MAQKTLKTVSIDDVDMDAITAGDYLKQTSDSKLTIPFTLYTQRKTITLETGTQTDIEMWTAPADGIGFVTYAATFSANATGSRASYLYSYSLGAVVTARQRSAATPTGNTEHSGFQSELLSQGNKLGIRLYQNSGSSLSVTLNIAIRFLPKTST